MVAAAHGGAGERVAASLLAATTRSGTDQSVLVVGNGSACRTEKAPGFLDERATAFDAHLFSRLRAADAAALARLDLTLASELQADVTALTRLAEVLPAATYDAQVDYDADPFGVQYWVLRWTGSQYQRACWLVLADEAAVDDDLGAGDERRLG